MRVVLVASVLAAWLPSCSPCEPDPLDDAPDAAPGEARHGVALGGRPLSARPLGAGSITATARGVACVTCDSIFYFDSSLHLQSRVFIPIDGLADDVVIATSGDTTIVLHREIPHVMDDDRAPRLTLFALSATGEPRWRVDEDFSGVDRIFSPTMTAGPASVVFVARRKASVLDPATGTLRWQATAPGLVVPDSSGGLLLEGSPTATQSGLAQWNIRHLDATGARDWAMTWTAGVPGTGPPSPGVVSEAAAATPDGGFVVAVVVGGPTLDLGDRVLQGTSALQNEFVLAIDKDGAVPWTRALGYGAGVQYIAATSDGVLVAGRGGGEELGLSSPANRVDKTYLAHIGRDGRIAAHALEGSRGPSISGLAAEADGSATVLVGNAGVWHLGDRTFDDHTGAQSYLLNIMP